MGPLDMPFVTDDYESLPPSILRFNPPYYHAFLKDAGFETERGYVDYRITVRPGARGALGERRDRRRARGVPCSCRCATSPRSGARR